MDTNGMDRDNKEVFHTVRGYQLLEHNKNVLTPALEDYLEMIYRNSLSDPYLRVNQLAELLNVKPSSASKMVQKLGTLGFVEYRKYEFLSLTETGRQLGEYLLNRHAVIEKFLEFIGADNQLLTQTELMEHVINDTTLNALQLFNSFFDENRYITQIYRQYKDKYLKNG